MAGSKYADLLKNKQKNGESKAITVKFLKMETKGETLVGKLISVAPTRGADSKKVYLQYTIETDSGLVKTAFGGAYDSEMAKLVFVGGVYAWTYQGEEKIRNGHIMRKFDTIELDLSEATNTAEDEAKASLGASEV